MSRLFRELSGYGAASVAALLFDLTVLWLLVQFCAVRYLAAASIAYLSGIVIAYMLSVRIAFREHRLASRRAEFLLFAAIGSIGLGINAGVIWVAVQLLGIHYLLAKCLAAGFTFCCNFVARRQILFIARSPAALSQ